MRNVFARELLSMAAKDKNIMLLAGDLGYSVFEPFIARFPKQYLNMGVSEQNMTGVAAGLALSGKTPFVYSIVPFATMRNFEQIRNDICYQNLNVKIVGVGAGFSYGPYGHTHHGLEDIGILRTLPNMTIFAPGDPIEAKFVVRAAMKKFGPTYIRLGRAGEPIVHKRKMTFKLGKGAIIEEGSYAAIFATSNMLSVAAEVVEMLEKRSLSILFVSMHTLKPIDRPLIIQASKKTKAIFTVEEHSIIGGLGSAVAEVLAEGRSNVLFKRYGVPDRFTKGIGFQEHMRDLNELSAKKIAERIIKYMKANQ